MRLQAPLILLETLLFIFSAIFKSTSVAYHEPLEKFVTKRFSNGMQQAVTTEITWRLKLGPRHTGMATAGSDAAIISVSRYHCGLTRALARHMNSCVIRNTLKQTRIISYIHHSKIASITNASNHPWYHPHRTI